MNKQDTIKRNLYMLFWKYPYLKNKNYNYLYFKYCWEFHLSDMRDISATENILSCEFWEKMPAMESISRCKRKLAKKDELFRADSKKVIESRLIQTSEILESVRD